MHVMVIIDKPLSQLLRTELSSISPKNIGQGEVACFLLVTGDAARVELQRIQSE